LDAFDHQDLPFEVLTSALAIQNDVAAQCLQVLFLFEAATPPVSLEDVPWSGFRGAPRPPRMTSCSRHSIFIVEAEEKLPLKLNLKYDTDLYSRDRAQNMLERLLAILSEGLARPNGDGF
jgi:hypothetical protein